LQVSDNVSQPTTEYSAYFIIDTIAGWTNIWRLYHTSRRDFPKKLAQLHRKYGPVVRIGPNVLDVESPELLKIVFNTSKEWRKVRSTLPITL
jgi:hypothetical protein